MKLGLRIECRSTSYSSFRFRTRFRCTLDIIGWVAVAFYVRILSYVSSRYLARCTSLSPFEFKVLNQEILRFLDVRQQQHRRIFPDLAKNMVLPELPSQVLIALAQSGQRDELDAFVLTGGVTSVEDILNDLIPNGTSRSRSTLACILLMMDS